jgi:hypothetical protein
MACLPVSFPFTSHLELTCLSSLVRAPEAFVSIQLEKTGLRDMMLNAFLLRKQTMADRTKIPVSVHGESFPKLWFTFTFEIKILKLGSVAFNLFERAIENTL